MYDTHLFFSGALNQNFLKKPNYSFCNVFLCGCQSKSQPLLHLAQQKVVFFKFAPSLGLIKAFDNYFCLFLHHNEAEVSVWKRDLLPDLIQSLFKPLMTVFPLAPRWFN